MASPISGGSSPYTTQIVATGVVTIGLAILAAFWAYADPRAEIRSIKDNYLTVREHQEFQTRVARDITRLEQENKHQVGNDTFKAWKDERDGVIAEIQRRLNEHVTREESAQRDKQIAELEKQIAELRTQFHEHERDDRIISKNGSGR